MSSNRAKKIRKEYKTQVAVLAGQDIIDEAKKLQKRKTIYLWVAVSEFCVIIGMIIFWVAGVLSK